MNYFQEIKNIIIPNFQKERQVLKNKLIIENNLEEKLLLHHLYLVKYHNPRISIILFLKYNISAQ